MWRAPACRQIGMAMQPIGPAPVMSTSSPTRSKESAVCMAFPSGSKQERTSSEMDGSACHDVARWDRDKFGQGAGAINADALRIRAKMAAAGETIPAMPASDVAFPDDEIALRKPAHICSNRRRSRRRIHGRWSSAQEWSSAPNHPSCKCEYRCRRSRPSSIRISTSSGADFRHRDLFEPQARFGFGFHDCLHRFLHRDLNLGEIRK